MELAGSWLISVGWGDWSNSATLHKLSILRLASPGVFFVVMAKHEGPGPSAQACSKPLLVCLGVCYQAKQVTWWGPESERAMLQSRLASRAGMGRSDDLELVLQSLCLESS